MSNKSSLRFLVVILLAASAGFSLVLADVGALGQNSNGTEESAQNDNANAPAPRRGRRGRRRPAAVTNTNDAGATTDAGAAIDPNGQAAAGTGDLSGDRADLSGTYTGHLTMSGGHEMSGDGTLTITGNTFTLTVDAMTHNGRVYAVTTRGYVGAAFYFTDITDPTTNTPVVANVRARKTGERLTLSPVPETRTRLTFASGGGAGGSRRGRRGRRGAGTTNTDTNSNTGDNSNTTPPR
ncbi:MAG TPA: hypothetical protein VF659_08930 [Pyrinomonadaceae bacterium]